MERTWALANREVQVILPFRYVAIISVILSKIVCMSITFHKKIYNCIFYLCFEN